MAIRAATIPDARRGPKGTWNAVRSPGISWREPREDPAASRRPLDHPRRRDGRAPVSAHAGSRETRRPVRRPLPHHRFRAQQLHQLRPHEDQGPDAVQVELAHRAHHPHLAPQLRHRPVRGPRAGPDAPRTPLVPGDGGRGLPEPRPDLRRGARARLRVRRRPHLHDGREPDAPRPRGGRARPHDRGDSRADRRGLAVRHPRGRRGRADRQLPREARRAPPDARAARSSRSRRWAITSSARAS